MSPTIKSVEVEVLSDLENEVRQFEAGIITPAQAILVTEAASEWFDIPVGSVTNGQRSSVASYVSGRALPAKKARVRALIKRKKALDAI